MDDILLFCDYKSFIIYFPHWNVFFGATGICVPGLQSFISDCRINRVLFPIEVSTVSVWIHVRSRSPVGEVTCVPNQTKDLYFNILWGKGRWLTYWPPPFFLGSITDMKRTKDGGKEVVTHPPPCGHRLRAKKEEVPPNPLEPKHRDLRQQLE